MIIKKTMSMSPASMLSQETSGWIPGLVGDVLTVPNFGQRAAEATLRRKAAEALVEEDGK